jgi:hypothetical protein
LALLPCSGVVALVVLLWCSCHNAAALGVAALVLQLWCCCCGVACLVLLLCVAALVLLLCWCYSADDALFLTLKQEWSINTRATSTNHPHQDIKTGAAALNQPHHNSHTTAATLAQPLSITSGIM